MYAIIEPLDLDAEALRSDRNWSNMSLIPFRPKTILLVVLFLIVVSLGIDSRADGIQVLRLGTGVNFGNMLEAPSEGEWGLKVGKDYFSIVKKAGFDHVRLPISWTYHAAKTA